MSEHPWASDPEAQAAVRAAEDAAAAERTPPPDHRDLPQAVKELRERVARLEAFTKNAMIREAETANGAVNPAADASAGDGDGLRDVRDSRTATVIDPGPGWRLLADDEVIEEGDEWLTAPAYLNVWRPTCYRGGGATPRKVGDTYRRRVASTPPQPDPAQITEGDTLATVRDGGGRPMPKGPPPGLKAKAQTITTDGLRTERVTLEITMPNGGREYHGDASSWDWTAILSHGKNFFGPGESVRVVEESVEVAYSQASIDRLTAERDAALRHIAATEQSRRDALRERDAARADLDGAMRGCVRLNNDLAALRGRVAELEAAPAANAGGEANQPWPMAFAVWGRGAVCGVTVSREDAGAMQREFAFDTEVMPLYAAPQPPRGWLTEEDCAALYLACAVLDGVFVGSWQEKHDAARRIVSIRERARREAGGEVE